MHVLIIPAGIYPLPQKPLDCVFEQQQAEVLLSAGLKVGVLSGGVITTRHLGRRFPYERRSLVNGMPVYRAHRRAILPARWESPSEAAQRTYQHLRPLLEVYIRDHGVPDVIHAHNLAAGGLLAARVLEDFGIPYVVTEHTGTYAFDLSAIRRDLSSLKVAADQASALIAVGTQLGENLCSGLGRGVAGKVTVVPNVVDPLLLSEPLGGRTEHYTVAGLGNLIPSKNYGLLLRAFATADLPRDARLVLGGKGPEAPTLRTLAARVGLGDRFDLIGQLDRSSVVRLMRDSDLFAHPSDGESFGVVLIEAMAMGVPVVATDSGGPADIVKSEVGRLVPVGDVDQFAEALTQMFARRFEFHQEVIRQACDVRFGPGAFAERMLAIYMKAAS